MRLSERHTRLGPPPRPRHPPTSNSRYIKETCSEQQWTDPLAKLLVEIKAAASRVRSAGGRELSEWQRAKFDGRYDRLVACAARLNPPPLGGSPPGGGVPRQKVLRRARH